MKNALLILLFMGCCFMANAQSKTPKPTDKNAAITTYKVADDEDGQQKLPPDLEMLRFFYVRYMVPYYDGTQPTDMARKQSQLRRTYCTPHCLDQYLELAQKSENEPFLKSPEADAAAVKSLQFTKDAKQPGKYLVTYELGEKITIELGLVNEKGEWKIDKFY